MSHHLSPRQEPTERLGGDRNPWLHAVPDAAATETSAAPCTPAGATIAHDVEAAAVRAGELERLPMSELRVLADQLGLSKGGSKAVIAERIARVQTARGLPAVPARPPEPSLRDDPQDDFFPDAASQSATYERTYEPTHQPATSEPSGVEGLLVAPLVARVATSDDLPDDLPDDVAPVTGPTAPHRTVPAPPDDVRLPLRQRVTPAALWWVGAHGGAGETTLAALVGGSAEGGHAWPVPTGARGGPAPVVLVARTSMTGLLRAQHALAQWASGNAGDVTLLGLALVADAPGRLPTPLRHLADLVAGGAPRTWHVPWVEGWRLGTPPAELRAPRPARRLARDVVRLTSS